MPSCVRRDAYSIHRTTPCQDILEPKHDYVRTHVLSYFNVLVEKGRKVRSSCVIVTSNSPAIGGTTALFWLVFRRSADACAQSSGAVPQSARPIEFGVHAAGASGDCAGRRFRTRARVGRGDRRGYLPMQAHSIARAATIQSTKLPKKRICARSRNGSSCLLRLYTARGISSQCCRKPGCRL